MPTERKLDFFEVEIKEKDLRALLVAKAISTLNNQETDRTFEPTIIADGYGGYKIFLKKKDKQDTSSLTD